MTTALEEENDILRAALHRIVAMCEGINDHGLPGVVACAEMALGGRHDTIDGYSMDAQRYRTLRILGYVQRQPDGLSFWCGYIGEIGFKDLKGIVKKCETGVATSHAMIDRFVDYLGEQARTVPSRPVSAPPGAKTAKAPAPDGTSAA